MTKQEIYTNLKQTFLSRQKKLTAIDEPGVISAIFEAVAAELESLYAKVDETVNQAFIDTATGEYLDKIGALVGCVRKQGTKATGTLRFSRTEPATRDYFIPKGTRCRTPLQADRTYLSFVTAQDATLEAGQTYVDVPAEAVEVGEKYNVPANSILIFETPVMGIEHVTNPEPFTGGADPESDDEYRARIPLYLESLKRATKTALESACLSVEGVTSVTVEDGETPGTVVITVAGPSGAVDQTVLDAVLQVLGDYKGAGIHVTLQTVTNVPTDVSFDLYVEPDYDPETVLSNAKQAVVDYLNNLDIGAPAQIAEIIAVVMSVEGVDNVKNVLIDGTSNDKTVSANEKIIAGTVTGTVI